MLYQLLLAFLFYGVFSLFAIIGLPLVCRFITNRHLAYATSKPLGFIVYGYAVWLLCDLHLLDYQNYTALLFLLTLALLGGIFMLWQNIRKPLPRITYPSCYKLLQIEAATLLVYVAYLWLRSHNAAINGTERFMDMALLTASAKTHFFPFADPWYAGKDVNYYYYGYYLVSLLSNLTKIPYVLSYNFALTLIFTYSVLLSATLVYAITYSKKAGALAAFLITCAGFLYFAGCTFKAYMADTECHYFSSTRLYDPSYTIREIPSYSFTVGDLHAHVMALPFFLLNLVLLYALVNASKPVRSLVLLLSLAFATSGMINSWDIITLMAIAGIALLIKATHVFYATRPSLMLAGKWLAVYPILIVGVGVLMWPDMRDFHSPVLGIGFIPSFISEHHLENVQYPTSLGAMLGVWGILGVGIALALTALWSIMRRDIFLSALTLGSLAIIVGIELVFIKDIYSITNPPYFRANTTFKFGYPAWVMLSLVFAVWMDRLSASGTHFKKWQVWSARTLVLIAVVGGAVYPYEAIKQFYLGNHSELTLNGADWMRGTAKEDFDTIEYINHNVHERVVIAEASGDSYSDYSRITTYTGMITPMGWQSHEWTWRFHVDAGASTPPGVPLETGWTEIAHTSGDVHILYETKDIAAAAQIIKQYHMAYVYVGELERKTYPELQEQKFATLGQVVFSSGNSRLYKLN